MSAVEDDNAAAREIVAQAARHSATIDRVKAVLKRAGREIDAGQLILKDYEEAEKLLKTRRE